MKKLFSILTATLLTVSQLGGVANIVNAGDEDTSIAISGATVTFNFPCSKIDDVYTCGTLGEKVQPTLTVKLGSTTLKLDEDYKVAFNNNDSVGTASAKIEGIGIYEGEISVDFSIVPATYSSEDSIGQVKYYVSNFPNPIASDGSYTFYKNMVTSTRMSNGMWAKNFTINLNGNNLTITTNDENMPALLLSRGKEDVKITGNGNIGVDGKAASVIGITSSDSKLMIDKGVKIGGDYGILIDKNALKTQLDFNGEFEGTNVGIYINGVNSGDNVITVGGDSKLSANYGIYAAGNGTWTIEEGANIVGINSAIELRAGNLNISGGTFKSTSEEFSKMSNGNGTTIKGAAVAISQHTTDLPISVVIDDGVFEGEYAIYEEDLQNETATDKIELKINGGTFIGQIYSENVEHFIYGGKFSEEINEDYIADGYKAVLGEDGYYSISEKINPILSTTLTDGKVGVEQTFTVSLDGKDYAGTKIIPVSTFTDKDGNNADYALESLIYVDGTEDGDDILNVSPEKKGQFGPEGGFQLPNQEMSAQFKVVFKEAGEFTMNLKLVDANDQTVVYNEMEPKTINIAEKTKPTLTSDLASSAKVGDKVNFSFSTVANDYGNTVVIALSEFNNDAALESLYSVNGETKTDILNVSEEDKGKFGPFPLIDGTSNFEVTFKTAGTYTFTVRLVDNTNNEIEYAKLEKTITISNKSSGGSSSRGGSRTSTSTEDKVAEEYAEETFGYDEATETPEATILDSVDYTAPDEQSLADFTETILAALADDADVLARIEAGLASLADSEMDQELKDAYQYALLRGITTMDSIEKADLERGMTRAEMAKMLAVFAQEVLGKAVVTTDEVNYADLAEMEGDLPGYIQLAYQLQIMGIDAEGNPIAEFRPHDQVTRAEFATVLSRVLFGDAFNQEGVYYEQHLAALKEAGILTNTTPDMEELRGWVMLMLMRTENVK